MAKTKISEFDVNPDNNTDINNINIAEGCAPSGINNAIRQLMSDLKEFQTGAGGDSITATGVFSDTVGEKTSGAGVTVDGVLLKDGAVSGAGAFTTLSASGAFSANGGATLGDASGDALTINSSAVSIPNGLNFDSNTFVIDAGNNYVGVGTSSPTSKLTIGSGAFSAASSGTTGLYTASYGTNTGYLTILADGLDFSTRGGSNRFLIDSSGNVGIGTSSPAAKFNVIGNSIVAGDSIFKDTATGNQARIGFGSFYSSGGFNLVTDGSYPLTFGINGTERMRIDSSGNLLIGSTNSSISVGVGIKFVQNSTAPTMGFVLNTASGGQNTYHLYNENATFNGYRFYVGVNGGIMNYSGNNINISDERTKTNIEVSGNYLDKICAIPVKLFNYKDEAEGEQRTLGVIAQDVEAVAPEFVNNDGWKGTEPEDGVPLKTIYTTDLMFGLMKSIQEQQVIITDLKARIETLESK